MTTGVIQSTDFRFTLFRLKVNLADGVGRCGDANEDLGRIQAEPEPASTDIEIDESGGKTNMKNKMIKAARLLNRFAPRQSPASGYEHVPKAVNSSKMDRM